MQEDNIEYVLASLEKIYQKPDQIMGKCCDEIYQELVEFLNETCDDCLKDDFTLDYLMLTHQHQKTYQTESD